ncbi:nucleoside triphosphate pyrophosphohydrolase [Mesorhizobium sp. M1322]|uniref:nucleoside triphosphate pyrophosphohydrolase n=1 Tax=Mesorhizobium sp. M1322 TaxID=2957081 RepID=UPI003337FAAB
MAEHPAIASQGDLTLTADFSSFQSAASIYGAKAAGLFLLPMAWVPKFAAVSTTLYNEWRKSGELQSPIVSEILGWIGSYGIRSLIVRSSSKNERITDRGKYRSVPAAGTDRAAVAAAIIEVFECARSADPTDEMALVLQDYKCAAMVGHLSNEVRVSPTRNQWTYEIENPWVGAKGLNSKFATSPDPAVALPSARQPHQTLRSVGRWCCDNFKPRCHIEWLVESSHLQIVQLDFEWRELDNGADPTKEVLYQRSTLPDPTAQKHLKQYPLGSATRWKKLRNLSEFDFGPDNPAPILFELASMLVSQARQDAALRTSIIKEVKFITGDRAVVRTDVDQKDFPRFNLPRTDTVCAADAVSWCECQLDLLGQRQAAEENVVFLIHAFLPALASAWAYADPNRLDVQIDALWGLPDGLQVLPVDSYEVIPSRDRVIQTPSTYKPMFLRETEDGQWTYINVLRSKGRSQVLPRKDILEIARRTKRISEGIGEFAQIMWFCGIPHGYGVGRNLPWFRSREKLDPAPRAEDKYKSFTVRNFEDLDKIPTSRAAIEFSPDANQIRNEAFLEAVIAKAQEHKLPVKLNGSVLGHVYYKLCEAEVGIILPNAAKYKRTRERRVFGKIVRDKIPTNISSGGEEAVEATLRKPDAVHGLSAKMVEELEELLKAKTDDEKAGELADVLEVVRGIAHELKVDWLDLVSRADAKKQRSGGFQERKVLVETSLPHPRRASERVGEVGLEELGAASVVGLRAEVPIAGIVNTVERKPITVKIPDAGINLQIALKRGKLVVSVAPIEGPIEDDDTQGSLF